MVTMKSGYQKEDNGMLDGLLSTQGIMIRDHVQDWQAALKLGVDLLVAQDAVKPEYYDAILAATNRFGPYYVLAPNIAMPHASANDGVIRRQISLLILKQPVRFKEDGYDVRLLFTLAAEDATTHLEALKHLARLFQDETLIQALMHAADRDTVVQLLQQEQEKGESS